MKKPLLILTGPTAVGKTDLSLEIAKRINGRIISADSMQVYRDMDIGTAKIKSQEMKGIKHYLIDELEPEEDFNVVKFKQYAQKYLEEIYETGCIPIIVGGTGFYIQALLYDIDFEENDADMGYRQLLEEQTTKALYEQLKEVDPQSCQIIHEHNKKKMIRALEYYKQTNQPISKHNESQRKKESPYQYAYFVLTDERAVLYDKINKRVDQMMEEGLLDEVKKLQERGCHKDMVSMQGIGYRQIFSYLDGECSLEEAVEKIKKDTRHFAKRQLTWFRRERDVIWVDKSSFSRNEKAVLDKIMGELKIRDII